MLFTKAKLGQYPNELVLGRMVSPNDGSGRIIPLIEKGIPPKLRMYFPIEKKEKEEREKRFAGYM